MLIQGAIRDLRYALRQLRKSPGFTLAAILTLAVGIGALTTVATWTNAVMYSPWPHVAAPRQIRFISARVATGNGYSVHYDQYRFVREQARSYQDGAAFELETVNLTAPGTAPQALHAGLVSSSYFRALGVQPQRGRFFAPDTSDTAFGANDEIVLSDRLWRDQFNADPGLVGRPISVNHRAFTVIGIAPADFYGIYGGLAEAAWVPLSSLRDLSVDAPPDPLAHHGLQMLVRLRPGVTDAAASAELRTLVKSFVQQNPNQNLQQWGLDLDDSAHMQKGFFGGIGEQLPVLYGASILLMLLVCINIVSLLGQHAMRRRREVAIRTALGARAGRIAAQVLTETALLGMAGGLAGWAMSTVLARAVYVLMPNIGIPLVFNLRTDPRILLFVFAVILAVTLGCGLFPMRQWFRISQSEALHAGGAAVAGRTQNRLGPRILLGAQLGICFVVLVCCGLFTRTAINIFNRVPGFNRFNVLTAGVDLRRSGYTQARAYAFQTTLLDRLRSAPGVAGVTLTSHLPMGDEGAGNAQEFGVPGYVPRKGEDMSVVTDIEGPDFFRTLGIPLIAGRDFAGSDHREAPRVAIINQAMASRFWPQGDAIGHSVEVAQQKWQIVGIIGDYIYHSPQITDKDPLLFLPLEQYGLSTYTNIAIRAKSSTESVTGQLRRAVTALDPSLPLENVRSLEDVSGDQYQFTRIPAQLLGVYALASLLVAMAGLYAVMSYSVIERYRELALRMALGSTRTEIFRLVLGGSAAIAGYGLVAGGIVSIAAVRLVRSMLFGVAAFDPVSYFAAAALLLLTALFSGLVPARRAASIEPMQALRTE